MSYFMDGAPLRPRPSRLALATAGALAVAAIVGPAAALSAPTHHTNTKTYTTPGVYSFAVPKNVTRIQVTAIGAAGGSCSAGTGDEDAATGGHGAGATATLAVKRGSHLLVGVGGAGGDCSLTAGAGGANGGASGGAGFDEGPGGAGGGGASGVLISPTKPLLVAGGGGGAGYCGANGGNADSPGLAQSATLCEPAPGGFGGAGTVAAGGSGGAAGDSSATAGAAGTAEFGGAGGNGDSTAPSSGGGGGGGGVHGGGGGGGGGPLSGGGGGGGGASFVTPSATRVSTPAPTTSSARVTITYTVRAPKAVTRKATSVQAASARLNGNVTPEGQSTTYSFQWGDVQGLRPQNAES